MKTDDFTAFQSATEHALQASKYNVLSGRTADFKAWLKEKVIQFLEKLFENIHLGNYKPPFYQTTLFFGIVMAVIVMVIIVISLVLVFRMLRRRQKRLRTAEELMAKLGDASVTDADILEESQCYAEKGQYREAVRLQFIAVLWVLGKQSIIKKGEFKTGTQIKREIKQKKPTMEQPFGDIVFLFNKAWFGRKPIDQEQFSQHLIRFENFYQEVRADEQKE